LPDALSRSVFAINRELASSPDFSYIFSSYNVGKFQRKDSHLEPIFKYFGGDISAAELSPIPVTKLFLEKIA